MPKMNLEKLNERVKLPFQEAKLLGKNEVVGTLFNLRVQAALLIFRIEKEHRNFAGFDREYDAVLQKTIAMPSDAELNEYEEIWIETLQVYKNLQNLLLGRNREINN